MKKYFIYLFLVFNTSLLFGQQPNIVFIMTDDQSSIPLRDSDNINQSRPFGFNGDSKVHTPIIDNLASNGIVFNNAFVSSSICSFRFKFKNIRNNSLGIDFCVLVLQEKSELIKIRDRNLNCITS